VPRFSFFFYVCRSLSNPKRHVSLELESLDPDLIQPVQRDFSIPPHHHVELQLIKYTEPPHWWNRTEPLNESSFPLTQLTRCCFPLSPLPPKSPLNYPTRFSVLTKDLFVPFFFHEHTLSLGSRIGDSLATRPVRQQYFFSYPLRTEKDSRLPCSHGYVIFFNFPFLLLQIFRRVVNCIAPAGRATKFPAPPLRTFDRNYGVPRLQMYLSPHARPPGPSFGLAALRFSLSSRFDLTQTGGKGSLSRGRPAPLCPRNS